MTLKTRPLYFAALWLCLVYPVLSLSGCSIPAAAGKKRGFAPSSYGAFILGGASGPTQ